MIIDSHNHIGPGPGQQKADTLIAHMDRAHVDRAVVFPYVEALDPGHNDWMAETVALYPKRLIGYAAVNPWQAGAADEVRRAVVEKGLRGLKLHPFLHAYSIAQHDLIDPIFEVCRDVRIPVVVHGAGEWSNMPLQFDEMARSFPDVTIVMAHMGTIWGFQEALLVATRRPNILLGTALAFSGFVRMAVERVGAEKVLMETDSPVQDFEAEIAKIEIAVPDRAARALVMGGNIARILRIG